MLPPNTKSGPGVPSFRPIYEQDFCRGNGRLSFLFRLLSVAGSRNIGCFGYTGLYRFGNVIVNIKILQAPSPVPVRRPGIGAAALGSAVQVIGAS
jgi:hypothetical protein